MRIQWFILAALAVTMASGCQHFQTMDEKRAEAHRGFDNHKARFKFALALEQFENGQMKQARQSIRETIGLHPDQPEYLLLYAKIQIEDGELAKAAATLRLLDPADHTPEFNYVSGLLAERYDRLEEALAAYVLASGADNLSRSYLMAHGETLVNLQRYDEALKLIEGRIEDFGGHWSLHALRAEILQLTNRPAEAADAMALAIAQNTTDTSLAESRALALHEAQRHGEAVAMLRALVVRTGYEVTAPAVQALALSSLAIGDYHGARMQLSRLTQMQRNNAHAWMTLAQAEVALGNFAAARFAAERGVHLAPEQPGAQTLLGFVRFKSNDEIAAQQALQVAVRVDPQDVTAWCLLGQVAAAQDHAVLAAQCYQQALRVDPQDPLATGLLNRSGHEFVQPGGGIGHAGHPGPGVARSRSGS
jgi:predicted Zn-dependent protease